VSCTSSKEAVIGLLSLYHLCNTDYGAKHKLMVSFIEFALTGNKHVQQAKRATQLIQQLKLV